MRADRLLNMLLLLQTRGRLTAAELAAVLEVSERTIYRDLDALSAAGIPVYAERGPGGGCRLLDSYRTTLNGLHEDEVRALFMLSVPAPLIDLGVAGALRGALIKLIAAQRAPVDPITERIHLDSTWWFQSDEPAPHLRVLFEAVKLDQRVRLGYRRAFGVEVERTADPYGLVAKAGVWYVVGSQNGTLRVHRVSELRTVCLLDELFERPADFNLTSFWDDWCDRYERHRPSYPVRVRVAPALLPQLGQLFGQRHRPGLDDSMPDTAGWMTMTLMFESLEEARRRLLGLGGAVEVLSPAPLRASVADFATQISEIYTGDNSDLSG